MNRIIRQFNNYYVARQNNLTLTQFKLRTFKKIKDKLLKRKLKRLVDNTALTAAHTAATYKILEKRYSSKLNENKEHDNKWQNTKFPKIIWWCWLQGEENAPALCKICLKSLRRNLPDYDIRILSWNTIENYIKLPDVILNKYKAGWISGAHYSDILRLAVLAKYGGIWIDSTCYCSDDKLIRKIEKKDMFMYQNLMTANKDIIKMSNWLIATKKNNPYIMEVSKNLINYYIKEDYVEDYFVCHILLSLFSKKYYEIWNGMDVYNNINPHMLQYVMNKKFNKDLFERIMQKSSFHKLNRHIDLSDGDTFYNYIQEISK